MLSVAISDQNPMVARLLHASRFLVPVPDVKIRFIINEYISREDEDEFKKKMMKSDTDTDSLVK